MNLITIPGNLNEDQYIRDVLRSVVVPRLDNHPLSTRPVCMDVRAGPHRSILTTHFIVDGKCYIYMIYFLASREPGFKTKRAYPLYVRPSCAGLPHAQILCH